MSNHRQWPITDDLAVLREHIQRYAVQAGLTGPRLDDLLIAANEAAINALEHGGGEGTLAIRHDDIFLSVDVLDTAGRLRPGDLPGERPTGRGNRGYGLWLINQLCDAVSIDQAPGQSRIRLSIRLSSSAQVGPAQVGPAQVGPAQVGPAQVRDGHGGSHPQQGTGDLSETTRQS